MTTHYRAHRRGAMPYRSALWQLAYSPRNLVRMIPNHELILRTVRIGIGNGQARELRFSRKPDTPAVWIMDNNTCEPIATCTQMDIDPKLTPFQQWVKRPDVWNEVLFQAREFYRRGTL